MSITITEFKNNFSKYLAMASWQEIEITKYGKVIARIVGPEPSVESLFGIIPSDIDEKAVLAGRVEAI